MVDYFGSDQYLFRRNQPFDGGYVSRLIPIAPDGVTECLFGEGSELHLHKRFLEDIKHIGFIRAVGTTAAPSYCEGFRIGAPENFSVESEPYRRGQFTLFSFYENFCRNVIRILFEYFNGHLLLSIRRGRRLDLVPPVINCDGFGRKGRDIFPGRQSGGLAQHNRYENQ